MTNSQMARKIQDLEQALLRLQSEVASLKTPRADAASWLDTAGCFKNDHIFEEAMKLGKKYRQRQRHRKFH